MMLLHEVDKPSSDIEDYVKTLDQILLHKIELISSVRSGLGSFYKNLKKEEKLQQLYMEKVQPEVGNDEEDDDHMGNNYEQQMVEQNKHNGDDSIPED